MKTLDPSQRWTSVFTRNNDRVHVLRQIQDYTNGVYTDLYNQTGCTQTRTTKRVVHRPIHLVIFRRVVGCHGTLNVRLASYFMTKKVFLLTKKYCQKPTVIDASFLYLAGWSPTFIEENRRSRLNVSRERSSRSLTTSLLHGPECTVYFKISFFKMALILKKNAWEDLANHCSCPLSVL